MSTSAPPPPPTLKDIDLDRLVRLIEVRPVIWNKCVEGYRNSKVTKAAWTEVFRELDKCYLYMNEEQKNEFGKVATAKWTNARDCWQRAWKKRRELGEPDPLPGSREALRHDRLKFLTKVYDRDHEIQQMIRARPHDQCQSPTSENSVDSEASTVMNLNINREQVRQAANLNENVRNIDQDQNLKARSAGEGNPSAAQSQQPTFTINVGAGTSHSLKYLNSFLKATPTKPPNVQQEAEKERVKLITKEENSISSSTSHFKVEPNESITSESRDHVDEGLENDQEVENRSPTIKKGKEENQRYSKGKRSFKIESEHSSDDEQSPKKRKVEDDLKNELLQGFFLSLVPLLKDFDCKQLIDFQMGALDLVKKIKYP